MTGFGLLGESGVEVSRFGLGTMMFGGRSGADASVVDAIVGASLDAGINVIDTADAYGRGDAERLLGRAIAPHRDEVVLITKCFFSHDDLPNHRGGSRRWIMRAVDESLSRLGTDWIDVLLLHRLDPRADPAESSGAIEDLIRTGKIRYGGTSGASGAELVETQWIAATRGWHRPAVEETQYSILTRGVEREVLPTCARHGIGVITYGPLNGGWLTGKYRRNESAPDGTRAARSFSNARWWDSERAEVLNKFEAVEQLGELAAGTGTDLIGLALAFAAHHPAIDTVLIGPRTVDQATTLLSRLDVELTEEMVASIDQIVPPATNVDPLDFVRNTPSTLPFRR